MKSKLSPKVAMHLGELRATCKRHGVQCSDDDDQLLIHAMWLADTMLRIPADRDQAAIWLSGAVAPMQPAISVDEPSQSPFQRLKSGLLDDLANCAALYPYRDPKILKSPKPEPLSARVTRVRLSTVASLLDCEVPA